MSVKPKLVEVVCVKSCIYHGMGKAFIKGNKYKMPEASVERFLSGVDPANFKVKGSPKKETVDKKLDSQVKK